MSLTVQQMINRLRAMPKGARVCFAAHDQDPHNGEFDGQVNSVDEAPPALKARGYGVVIQ